MSWNLRVLPVCLVSHASLLMRWQPLIPVTGTSFVYDDASRQVEVGSAALKYDRNGREPIILVPQPSDDPNDPLASSPDSVQTLETLSLFIPTELVPLEARFDPYNSLPPLGYSVNPKPVTRCKYRDFKFASQEGLYADGPPHGVAPMRSRGGRIPFRRFRKSMGQKTSVPSGYFPHHCQQRLGRCGWIEL